MAEDLTIGFIGNPNCGKTTLFNAYTGANLKVANWPGVTVEKKEGAMRFHDENLKLVDLPGTYSLTSYSMEEIVTRQYILSEDVDVLINVVDASALERNLYLTLQLIELGKPVILALNMMDVVEKQGMEIDLHRLPEMLGIPAIPVSARKRKGLDILMHAAVHHKNIPTHPEKIHGILNLDGPAHLPGQTYGMVYSDEIENKIAEICGQMKESYPHIKNVRWYALKHLEADEEIIEKYPILPTLIDKDYGTEIINQKYDFIEEIVQESVVHKNKAAALTDRLDGLFTNRWLGLPVFLAIMGVVFFFTFTLGDWLKGYFETGLESLSQTLEDLLLTFEVQPMMISLLIDGIIAGVGGILTFLPNIFILFLGLAFLEDSGYMARVAYVMDSIMGKLGLSGKAFIPMLLGFGCTVPALMASRTLESNRDRYKVMLITPFMSCSAKLPIYIMFSQLFFTNSGLAAYSMYVLGLLIAVLTAFIISRFEKDPSQRDVLLMELPEYKAPSSRTIFIYIWQKIKDYLARAGTTIFIASIVMWFLLNFSIYGYTDDMSLSFGSTLGRLLVPVLKPVGLGFWQIAVALVAGLTAKEVVVSSSMVLFEIPNSGTGDSVGTLAGVLAGMGFGALNAYAMMVFCLLYTPCIAAVATIRKETQSWAWTGGMTMFQLGMAWLVTFIVYQGGRILGF